MGTILFIIFLVVMAVITLVLLRASKLGDIQHEKNIRDAKRNNTYYNPKR